MAQSDLENIPQRTVRQPQSRVENGRQTAMEETCKALRVSWVFGCSNRYDGVPVAVVESQLKGRFLEYT